MPPSEKSRSARSSNACDEPGDEIIDDGDIGAPRADARSTSDRWRSWMRSSSPDGPSGSRPPAGVTSAGSSSESCSAGFNAASYARSAEIASSLVEMSGEMYSPVVSCSGTSCT